MFFYVEQKNNLQKDNVFYVKLNKT